MAISRWTVACVALSLCFASSSCHWYLLLSAAETKKLLGVPGELFYVKEGVVNEYALAFNLNIQPEVEEMIFEWYNDVTHPSTPQVEYTAKVHVSNGQAILQPYLKIPSHGVLPTRRSPFSLFLKCAGDVTAEVDVRLRLEFRLDVQHNNNNNNNNNNNLTVVEMKRRKICLRDPQGKRPLKPVESAGPNVNQKKEEFDIYGDELKDRGSQMSGRQQVVIIGCAVGAFLVVFLIAIFCCYRSRKRTNSNNTNSGSNNHNNHIAVTCPTRVALPAPLKSQEGQNYCTYTSGNDSVSSGSSHQHTLPFPCQKPTTYQEAVYLLNEMKFNRNMISLGEVMLQGLHGSVYRGYANLVSPTTGIFSRQQVIIKAFLDESNFDPISSSMLTDACLLVGLQHANLAPCLGSCLDHFPVMVVYEDAGFENLKIFLSRMKGVELLSPQQLTYVALQVARGLAFLHSKKILHRDVAARNCLVTGNLQVRLGDSFLTSDIFPDDYQPSPSGSGEFLPVRWMAIESMADSSYTPASDIWSLGVFVWELFSGAETPYEHVATADLPHHLVKGFRLQQPKTCPNELFAMTSQCWMVSPGERPKMNHLLTYLVNFYNTLSRFV